MISERNTYRNGWPASGVTLFRGASDLFGWAVIPPCHRLRVWAWHGATRQDLRRQPAAIAPALTPLGEVAGQKPIGPPSLIAYHRTSYGASRSGRPFIEKVWHTTCYRTLARPPCGGWKARERRMTQVLTDQPRGGLVAGLPTRRTVARRGDAGERIRRRRTPPVSLTVRVTCPTGEHDHSVVKRYGRVANRIGTAKQECRDDN